ncbi:MULTISPECIES: hypothetical protein [Candidatus Ichthyocystis]|uniref:hypothetical protein n=2 Tax=Burkholderiales genera incertae sedis TaxID=224471 RepID=UPI000B87A084|nr:MULTISPECIES: hypothetical protein [Ichthyocystis]
MRPSSSSGRNSSVANEAVDSVDHHKGEDRGRVSVASDDGNSRAQRSSSHGRFSSGEGRSLLRSLKQMFSSTGRRGDSGPNPAEGNFVRNGPGRRAVSRKRSGHNRSVAAGAAGAAEAISRSDSIRSEHSVRSISSDDSVRSDHYYDDIEEGYAGDNDTYSVSSFGSVFTDDGSIHSDDDDVYLDPLGVRSRSDYDSDDETMEAMYLYDRASEGGSGTIGRESYSSEGVVSSSEIDNYDEGNELPTVLSEDEEEILRQIMFYERLGNFDGRE